MQGPTEVSEGGAMEESSRERERERIGGMLEED